LARHPCVATTLATLANLGWLTLRQQKVYSDIEAVEIVFKDGLGYDLRKLIESGRGLVGLR